MVSISSLSASKPRCFRHSVGFGRVAAQRPFAQHMLAGRERGLDDFMDAETAKEEL
jgi:hypothetical protein